MVAEATVKEAMMVQDGVSSIMREWVPTWILEFKNEKTMARYRAAWAWLAIFFAEKGILHPAEVSARTCHDYMAWRTAGKVRDGVVIRKAGKWNTALCEIRFLGTVLRESGLRGFCMSNPCAGLRLGRERPKEKHEITADDEVLIREALKAKPEWMRDCFEVGIRHGCRLRECAVPMDQIRDGIITFQTKGGREHSVPIHPAVKSIVERARKSGRKVLVDMPDLNASKDWQKFFKGLGMPYTFHCCRVSVVTRLARAGVTEAKSMRWVGHSTTIVHSVYRKLKPGDMDDAMDAL